MNGLFSLQGRLNRQKYFFMTLLITIVAVAVAFVIGFMAGMAGMSPDAAVGLGFFVGIGAVVIQAFLVVKRCHDLDKPGTNYWLMYIPLYNLYFGLVLLFTKGSPGPNQYGEDPTTA
jgi:uncharacterized membrane protein YhaH (DUF805 family)